MKIEKADNNSENFYYKNVNENEGYIGVNSLIASFIPKFDSEFWSAYKALEKLIPKDAWQIEKKSLLASKRFKYSLLDLYNISKNDFNREQQLILDEWDEQANKSKEKGILLHKQLENQFKNKKDIDLKKFGFGGKFSPKEVISLEDQFGVYPELAISIEFDKGIFRLNGRIDLLIKNNNEITIIDWKSCKKIDMKGGFNSQKRSSSKMLYPINNIDDANYYHYTLQLSMYAWMLQRKYPNFLIKDLILVHFDNNNKETVYHVNYMKKEVELLLKYYEKKLLHKAYLDKCKPFEY